MLDQAFEALKTYDWGTDPKVLSPIDEAMVATRGDAAARKELEARLVAVLKTDVSRDAKDFVCRKLTVIGTAASVPALAELLAVKDLSHMARYALERIPAPEAAQAMRDALPKIDNALKVGVMGSLGVRQDVASVPALVALLGDADATVARSAALALGAIRRSGSRPGVAGSQAGKRRGENRRNRRLPGVCRRVVGRRQEGRSDGDLQGLHRRRPAQARSPGRDARHAGLRWQDSEYRQVFTLISPLNPPSLAVVRMGLGRLG